MKSNEPGKSDRLSVITAVLYVVTVLIVMGIALWLTQLMVTELGHWMKFVYPNYGMNGHPLSNMATAEVYSCLIGELG